MAEYEAAGAVANLVDFGNLEIGPGQYAFVASAGDCTITGFFVAISGMQIGVGSTGTISSTPITLLGALGLTVLPADAVGFVGRTSADVLLTPGGSVDGLRVIPAIGADMAANPTFYPILSATTDLHLGRG
jgi:hypothetical protein